MTYQHDIFISYRRQELWTPWVRDHLKPLLESYLQQELGKKPDIFVDERIEVGADWVDELGTHLATSKVVVAVFSRDYFDSPWCVHELDLILERGAAAKGASAWPRVIVPTVVHDGELIPGVVQRVQPCDLKKYRNTHICRGSTLYEEFSGAIGRLAPAMKDAIHAAPAFDVQWVKSCQARFNEVLDDPNLAATQFDWQRPGDSNNPPNHGVP